MKNWIWLFLLCIATPVFARTTSVGDAASNVNVILEAISGILEVVFYIAGAAVLVSAAMKFRIHRQNPQQVHISTPITELVLAIVLIALPFVSKLANEHLFQSDHPPSQSTPKARVKPAKL